MLILKLFVTWCYDSVGKSGYYTGLMQIVMPDSWAYIVSHLDKHFSF